MTTPRWAPDHPIDAALAERTIAAQFPGLAGLPVRQIGAGWDNAVFGVGDAWVFRFIHRSLALEGAAAELEVLRALPPDLPLPVPRPQHVGTPTPEVPWPFWGAHHLPGVELPEARLRDDARTPVAASLGAFLRRLHDRGLTRQVIAAARARGVELRADPWSRGTPSAIVPRARQTLDRLAATGVVPADSALTGLLADAADIGQPDEPPVLVHGDLHVRHVLVEGRSAAGVIDWGDAGLGDPAVDLMIGYQAFAGAAREAFFAAYGPVSADRRTRARVLAVHVAAGLAEQAAADGMTAVSSEARAALVRATRP